MTEGGTYIELATTYKHNRMYIHGMSVIRNDIPTLIVQGTCIRPPFGGITIGLVGATGIAVAVTTDPMSSKELLLTAEAPLFRVVRSCDAGGAKLSLEGSALCDWPCGGLDGVATEYVDAALVRVDRSTGIG